MLVLSRKLDEVICIGDNIRIRIVKLKGNTVRIGIEAPQDIKVLRGELEFEQTHVGGGSTEAQSQVTTDSSDRQQSAESVSDQAEVFVFKTAPRPSSSRSISPTVSLDDRPESIPFQPLNEDSRGATTDHEPTSKHNSVSSMGRSDWMNQISRPK